MPILHVLRSMMNRGGAPVAPIFSGVASASDLATLCQVPSFSSTTTHAELAENIVNNLHPLAGAGGYPPAGVPPGSLLPSPTRMWQRPQNPNKITSLGAYYTSHTDDLMPNPIIIGVSDNYAPTTLTFNAATANLPYGELEISIPQGAPDNAQTPFLVIDGQHRLNGLASNPLLRDMSVPFVLLWDDTGGGYYSMDRIAGIFATVTTQATDLQEPHRNWMSFSFGLNPSLSPPNPFSTSSTMTRQAYEVALILAARNRIIFSNGAATGTSINTIFNNYVQLNPEITSYGYLNGGSNGYGMRFTIESLTELVRKVAATTSYDTMKLAYTISAAMQALHAVDTNAASTSRIFPDAANNGWKVIREGVTEHILKLTIQTFFAGAAPRTLLLRPTDWQRWLTNYSFNADWSLSWTSGTNVGGKNYNMPWSTRSRNVLQRVLDVRTQSPAVPPIPGNITNIVDSLQGSQRVIQAIFLPPTGSGNASTSAAQISAALGLGSQIAVNKSAIPSPGSRAPHIITNLSGVRPAPTEVVQTNSANSILVLIHGQTRGTSYSDARDICYNSLIMKVEYATGGVHVAGTELAGIFSQARGLDVSAWTTGTHEIDVHVCSLGADTWNVYRIPIRIL